MRKMEERIATLEQQLKALKERHQKTEAKRKRQEAQRAKKDDVRRKMLAGTVVLEKVDRGEIDKSEFRRWVDSVLREPEDRALFDL